MTQGEKLKTKIDIISNTLNEATLKKTMHHLFVIDPS